MKVNCALVGAAAVSGQAQLLYHSDFNACNTFENPDLVTPKPHPVSVAGARVGVELPPISIAAVSLKLA
jgi:alpha-L-arabinofuranosidase